MSKAVQNALKDELPASYIMIAGPTASGKSQLAVDLACQLDGEVINADSMQLYADLSILTARPSNAEMQDIPHHLYGVLDGGHRASVAAWLELAATAMTAIRARGKMPIIIGGTGMYLDAAVNGIAVIPDVPAIIHEDCMALFDAIGGAAFRQKLALYDPLVASRLADGDRQRLIRAMGVFNATGIALGQFQQAEHECALAGRPVKIAMLPPRDVLYARIDARFDVMLEQGAMDEVRQLMSRQLDPSLPLMKALGVTALKAVLEQEMTVDEAAYIAKRDSRHYAKRQMTWLRNNYNAQITINTKLSESFMESIFSLIR
ncbi:tRNA (adenosine(37)-N6)-dimethylallyltransferase MiaA [Alphaproteobacteria bacterium]|nr:tRNA (adenosine(37)-N6)-dimethylallyltransferase MiaA [Alphaproteobacteria bacterium]